jgi:hypothetical protein
MDKFNNQFATQKLRQEMSVTGTGATFTPGTGEQMATNKAFKKKQKKEVKDVEPKLAAGNAKVYAKEKWGWKDAPSVPNRPSKGGFIYKQLFEELSNFVKENQLNINNEAIDKVHIGTDTKTDSNIYFEPSTGTFSINVIDGLGNRWNKLEVNTIDDVVAKFPSWSWTEKGIQMFPEFEPEEQGDDEDSYDWFTNSYEKDNTSLDEANVPDNIKRFAKRKGISSLVNKVASWAEKAGKRIVDGTAIGKNYSTLILDLTYQGGEIYINTDNDTIEVNGIEVQDYNSFASALDEDQLNESYSKFKNETKTRGKADQFHQAVRQVRQRVQEINRLFEYVSRLKSELSEGEGGLKYKVHTEKALAKIKEMVAELNQNIKKFK